MSPRSIWRESRRRSHNSRDYDERFILQLDRPSSRQLQQLAQQFETSRAPIIRQLIAQASPEDFPESWRLAVNEHRALPDSTDALGS